MPDVLAEVRQGWIEGRGGRFLGAIHAVREIAGCRQGGRQQQHYKQQPAQHIIKLKSVVVVARSSR
jgi:hypothetical protein